MSAIIASSDTCLNVRHFLPAVFPAVLGPPHIDPRLPVRLVVQQDLGLPPVLDQKSRRDEVATLAREIFELIDETEWVWKVRETERK